MQQLQLNHHNHLNNHSAFNSVNIHHHPNNTQNFNLFSTPDNNAENYPMLHNHLAPSIQISTEEDSTLEPRATYSYLKSYFVSMLQPSDNKLAMKLFGSKKGVLKEKLRQQEVSHWIIHPCSNFRYV